MLAEEVGKWSLELHHLKLGQGVGADHSDAHCGPHRAVGAVGADEIPNLDALGRVRPIVTK